MSRSKRRIAQLTKNKTFIYGINFYACSSGTNVTVRIPVPKATVSVSHEPLGPGHVSEMRQQDKTNVWKIKKIEGGMEQILILKASEELENVR